MAFLHYFVPLASISWLSALTDWPTDRPTGIYNLHCACKTHSNKAVVRQHTTFILANPIAATSFSCTSRGWNM